MASQIIGHATRNHIAALASSPTVPQPRRSSALPVRRTVQFSPSPVPERKRSFDEEAESPALDEHAHPATSNPAATLPAVVPLLASPTSESEDSDCHESSQPPTTAGALLSASRSAPLHETGSDALQHTTSTPESALDADSLDALGESPFRRTRRKAVEANGGNPNATGPVLSADESAAIPAVRGREQGWSKNRLSLRKQPGKH